MRVQHADGTTREPKPTSVIECPRHGVKTTWGELDSFQRHCVGRGIFDDAGGPCVLAPRESKPS